MTKRLPPLNALRAFEASARLGSFVAAAAELHVSAAAVSQHVRRLERYLDTALFQRLPRGLVLTEEGRAYWPELAAFASGWLLPRLERFRGRAPPSQASVSRSAAARTWRRCSRAVSSRA